MKYLTILGCVSLCQLTSAFAQAVPDHQLVLTEQSSSVLTATFDGSPVALFGAGDAWVLTPSSPWLIPNGFLQWAEPSGNLVNVLGVLSTTFVLSDANPITAGPINANGATVTAAAFDAAGVPIDITFNDLGDSQDVPEAATTAMLLLFPVAAMFGAKQLRRR